VALIELYPYLGEDRRVGGASVRRLFPDVREVGDDLPVALPCFVVCFDDEAEGLCKGSLVFAAGFGDGADNFVGRSKVDVGGFRFGPAGTLF